MRPLDLEALGRWTASTRGAEPEVPSAEVDWGRPFTPEPFTQLYHTPVYASLSVAQRLRYNQLFGLRINEQFQVFESGFTRQVMLRLMEHRRIRREPVLRQCIEGLIEDERRHDRMFRRLNREAAPALYGRSDTFFTRLGMLKRLALWWLSRAVNRPVPMLWFILLMEEYSNALSRAMLAPGTPGDLGPLDPAFLAVHRRHLEDELRHVHVDARLLDLLIEEAPEPARRSDVQWLHRFLREILAPKHAARRVVERLVHDRPELGPRRRSLHASLAGIGLDPVMARVLRDRTHSPLTHALGERYPDFGLMLTSQCRASTPSL